MSDWSPELSDADRVFDEALRLLDQGHGTQAEGLLELVLRSTRASGDGVLRTKTLCVLGEWLLEQNRPVEGRECLNEALELDVMDSGLVAAERERVRELLRIDRMYDPAAARRE